MRCISRLALLTFVTSFGAAFQTAAAQDEPPRTKGYLELAIIRGSFDTDHFAMPNVKGAFGFDVAIALEPEPWLVVAGGVQYASHFTSDSTGSVGMVQFYVEPRVMLTTRGAWMPYVGARLGYVRASLELDLYDDLNNLVHGQGVQSGQSFGATAGVLYKASHNVRTFASVTVQKIRLGNMSFDEQPLPSTDSKGDAIVIRAGVSFDFSVANAAAGLRRR